MNANRARLLQEFDQLKNTRWDTGKEICPTCGQKIPADAVEKLRENFLQGKFDKLTAKIEVEPPATDGNVTDYEQTSEYKEYSKKLTELNAQYEYEKLQKEWHAPDTSEIDKKLWPPYL